MKFLLSLLLFVSFNVFAEPIEFISRSTPGAGDDIFVRKVVAHLEADTNLKFIVSNRPSSGHVIAYNYFESKTKPMLLVADKSILNHTVISVSERIFNLGYFTNILFVKNGTSIRSFNDLVNLSKEREITFGHGGEGSASFEAANSICQTILRCLLVPYKSGGQAMLDMAAGTIDAYALTSIGSTSASVNNDMYRGILIYSTRKHPTLDLPLLPKQYKDIEIRNLVAVYGRNLSTEDRNIIQQSLNKMKLDFFIENGLYK